MDFVKVDLEWCRNEIGRIKDFASRLELVATTTNTTTRGARHAHTASLVGDEENPMLGLHADADQTQTAVLEAELVSLYESCHSSPWRNVLQMASGSIKASLEGSTKGPI